MFISKVNNNEVISIGPWQDYFRKLPSDEKLAAGGFKKVNLFVPHNPDTEKLVSTTPFVDGEFVTTVAVAPLTAEELEARKQSKAAQLRTLRNQKLQECDWIVIKAFETNSNIPAKWEIYRQELRDLPQNTDFPDVVFPVSPDEVGNAGSAMPL